MTRHPRHFTTRLSWLVGVSLLIVSPRPSFAQLYESVGTRAQGMAGAFTAVADDATTTWWNPAGLNTGPLFGAIVQYRGGTGEDGEDSWGLSVMVPSLGLSYYRIRVLETSSSSSTAPLSGDRQDKRAVGTRLSSFALNQFGATVGQSLGDHLVLGTTLQLLQADQVRGDVDAGAMATFGAARFAAVVKHIVAPDMSSDGHRLDVDRQVRIGAAWDSRPRGRFRMTAAADADLTRTSTVDGDERHLAGGVEAWVSQAVSVRGGVSVNTIGDLRASASVGGSVAVRSGLFIDGEVTAGKDAVTKGWGLGLRATF